MLIDLRKYPRIGLALPIEVKSYQCERGAFVSYTETLSLSPLGASFLLRQEVVEEDLIHLSLVMPPQLRLYDYDLPEYQVYAQVRRTKQRPNGYIFVGVAFISKDPPDGDYRSEEREKHHSSMTIRGLSEDGNYFIEVIKTEDVSKHGLCFFISRRQLKVGSILEILGFQGKFSAAAEVRHISYNSFNKNYRVGVRLSGEPNNWIVK